MGVDCSTWRREVETLGSGRIQPGLESGLELSENIIVKGMCEFRIGTYFMSMCVTCILNSPTSVWDVGSACRDTSVGVGNRVILENQFSASTSRLVTVTWGCPWPAGSCVWHTNVGTHCRTDPNAALGCSSLGCWSVVIYWQPSTERSPSSGCSAWCCLSWAERWGFSA